MCKYMEEDVFLTLCLAQDTNIALKINGFLYMSFSGWHKSIVTDKRRLVLLQRT